MSNQLFSNQNELVDLQCAKNQLYREAVQYNSFALSLAILSALVIPFLALLFPEQKFIWSTAGGILGLLAAFAIKDFSKNKKFKAAQMQELFDTKLYNIEWNKSLAKTKPSQHEIASAVNKNKVKQPKDFKEWYRDYSNLEPSLAALHCQRENLYWDKRQRKAYFRILLSLSLAVVVLGIILMPVFSLSTQDYFFNIFFPQSGLVIYFLKIAIPHWTKAQDLDRKYSSIQAEMESIKQQGNVPSSKLREIQDFIFESRITGEVTPSWFYNIYNKTTGLQKTITDASKIENQI